MERNRVRADRGKQTRARLLGENKQGQERQGKQTTTGLIGETDLGWADREKQTGQDR